MEISENNQNTIEVKSNTIETKEVIKPEEIQSIEKIEVKKTKKKKEVKQRSGRIGSSKYIWEEVYKDELPEIVIENLENLISEIDEYLTSKGIGYKLIFSKIYEKDTKFNTGMIVKVFNPNRSPNLIFRDFKLFKGSVGLLRDGIEIGYSRNILRYSA